MTTTIRERAPRRGEHVRAMNYARGSVAAGTHSWAVMTFTGTVKGTVRDGAPWVAIALDRDLTIPEHAALIDAGGRIISAAGTTAAILPADTLDMWTFEALTRPVVVPVEDTVIEPDLGEYGRAVMAELQSLAVQGRSSELFPERMREPSKVEMRGTPDPPRTPPRPLPPMVVARLKAGLARYEDGGDAAARP